MVPMAVLSVTFAAPAMAGDDTDATAPLRLTPELGVAGMQCAAAGLNQPVPGATVTSPFGWRIHPILKVRRFHKGVDYGAPAGTPVLAAADGVIEDMGRVRRFGWFVRIRHGAQLETAYNHLSGFTPGLAVGASVSAGQVIGKVGHSGWSTGPHLDFEVVLAGRNVAPCPAEPNKPVRLLAAETLQSNALLLSSAAQWNAAPLMHAGSP